MTGDHLTSSDGDTKSSVTRESAPRIRLIACDMDGTLIGPGGSGVEIAKQAVDYCKSRGCAFTLATGRVFGSVERYLESLGITEPVITNGGALVAERGKPPIMQRTIDPTTARSVATYLRKRNLPFTNFV